MGKKKILSAQKGKVFTAAGASTVSSGLILACIACCCWNTRDRQHKNVDQDAREPARARQSKKLSNSAFQERLDILDRSYGNVSVDCAPVSIKKSSKECMSRIHMLALDYESLQPNSAPKERQDSIAMHRDKIVALQSEILPRLRDSFGPSFRSLVRKVDGTGTGKTTGEGYQTFKAAHKRHISSEQACKDFAESIKALFGTMRFNYVECAKSLSSKPIYRIQIGEYTDSDILCWDEKMLAYRPVK